MNVCTFFLCGGLLALAACSSTSTSSPAPVADAQSGDGSASGEDAATNDDAPSDGADDPDTGAPRDSATGTDTTTAACNSLTDQSSGVIPVFQAGSPPNAQGGTIPPGVYVLTAVTQYGGSGTTAKEFGTIQIGTSMIQRVEGSLRTTQGFEYGENQIFYTYLCAPGGLVGTNVDAKFETTSTTFTEYVPFGGGTRKRTFTVRNP